MFERVLVVHFETSPKTSCRSEALGTRLHILFPYVMSYVVFFGAANVLGNKSRNSYDHLFLRHLV